MTGNSTEEQLVFFPCGESSLAGILTSAAAPNGRTILIPWGAGAYPSSGRNRIRSHLARLLAEQGFYSFRFDYRGVGESGGNYRKPDLAEPNTDEVVAACAWLNAQGHRRIVVVANCFGGWSSLMAAPMISGLEGVALINTPVRRDHAQARAVTSSYRWWAGKVTKLTLRNLRDPDRRALYRKLVAAKFSSFAGSASRDTRFSRAIEFLVERRIPLLLLYGDDPFRVDLEAELDRGLRATLEKAEAYTRLVMLSERLEGLASVAAQDALLNGVIAWSQEIRIEGPGRGFEWIRQQGEFRKQ